MRLILTNCNVIDCVNPDPKSQSTVVIEDGRILEIRDGGPPSRNSKMRTSSITTVDCGLGIGSTQSMTLQLVSIKRN